jgi:hypothetical protein
VFEWREFVRSMRSGGKYSGLEHRRHSYFFSVRRKRDGFPLVTVGHGIVCDRISRRKSTMKELWKK